MRVSAKGRTRASRSPSRSPTVAVVGCGYWGQNLVRNFYQLGALAIVCDSEESARAKAIGIAPGVPVAADYETAFTSDEIDAVVLATPAETHHPLTMRALSAGKDVFVEKPLALNAEEGSAMRDHAERTGRILMVGHLLDYHPAVLELRRLVADRVLGRVNYIYSNRLNFGKIRILEDALWSFAPHDVGVILRLVGEMPIEVTCSGGNYITPNLADVTISCLHFRTGIRAHIFVSWINPFKEQKLVVVGDRKMAVFNDLLKADKLVLYDQHVDLNNRQPVLQKGEMEVVEVATDEPLRKECEHFLECVRTRQQPASDAARGLEVLRVLQACQVSLELNGRPVVLSSF